MVRNRVTQVDLARRLELSQSQCSRLVNGLSAPSVEQALKIEQITRGVSRLAHWGEMAAGPLPELLEHRGRRRKPKRT